MKFRFRPSNKKKRLASPTDKRKVLRLRGIGTVRIKRSLPPAMLPSAQETKKRKTSKAKILFHRLMLRLQAFIKKEPRVPLSVLLKTLFLMLGATALFALVMTYTLFFSYGGAYTEIEIPSFAALDVSQALAVANDLFEYEIVYQSNPEHKGGAVIAQKPAAGVIRRLYKGDGRIKITLSVNEESDYITLPRLSGKPLRDTALALRQAGIEIRLVKEHSSEFASGSIISASPSSGSRLKKGDVITLTVSLGKEATLVTVPSLLGKSESEALYILERLGLKTDSISYESSNGALGTVISQSIPEGTRVLEGCRVSLGVSKGPYYSLN